MFNAVVKNIFFNMEFYVDRLPQIFVYLTVRCCTGNFLEVYRFKFVLYYNIKSIIYFLENRKKSKSDCCTHSTNILHRLKRLKKKTEMVCSSLPKSRIYIRNQNDAKWQDQKRVADTSSNKEYPNALQSGLSPTTDIDAKCMLSINEQFGIVVFLFIVKKKRTFTNLKCRWWRCAVYLIVEDN